MAYKKIAAACILGFLLTACQSTTSGIEEVKKRSQQAHKPTWIKELPLSTGMIYGVGSAPIYSDEASAVSAAAESARLEVAKVIRVNVDAVTQVEQESGNGAMSFYFKEAIANSVNNMDLVGLTVSDNYIDKDTATAYALAVYNKAEAIVLLQKQIAQIDTELESLTIDFSQAAGEKLSQAIYLKKQFTKRADFNAQLENLSVLRVVLTAKENSLKKDIDKVFNSIVFGVFAQSEDGVQDKLVAAITDQGLRVNNQKSDFNLIYQVKWRDLAKGDLFYSIASSTVTIKSGDTILKVFKAKAKGSSSDKRLAKDKAVAKLAQQFSHRLSKELLTSFEQIAPTFN